jgi:hypothetical protein
MTDKNIVWKLSEVGACLCIGSGQLFFKDKTPQGISYETIIQMIKDRPNDDAYQQIRKRRLTLGKALAMDKLELLGEEVNLSTTISLHTIKHDRNFEELPQTGKELISKIFKSKPQQVNEEIVAG